MAKQLANDQIRDQDQHDYPIKDSGPDTTYLLHNDLDAAINYDIEGTWDGDDDFSDAVTISSGTALGVDSTASESFGGTWDRVRFRVTAGTTPTEDALRIMKMG